MGRQKRSRVRSSLMAAATLLAVALLSIFLVPGAATGASGSTNTHVISSNQGPYRAAALPGSHAPSVGGEVIVQFAHFTQAATMRQLALAQGATVKSIHAAESSRLISFAVFSSKSLSTDQLIAKFKGRSNVVAVSANNYEYISTIPNDPQFPNQWDMQNSSDTDIDAPEAWDLTTGSSDVVVAVIDTGMAYTHEDLKDNVWTNSGEIPGNGIDDDGNGYVDDVHGIDAVDGTSDPWDDNSYGHGTHVSGTIAAEGNNGIGVAGVSWKTKIMPLKFLDSSGSGSDEGAIACINYAIDMKLHHGVNLVAINASWGTRPNATPDLAMKNAIQAAGDAGIIFCAAAGNDGIDLDSNLEYPAAYPCSNIISVGASNSSDQPASYSNFGVTDVDLFAPGTGILSTIPGYADSFLYKAPSSTDIFYDGMQGGAGNWTPSGTWAITNQLWMNDNLSWSDSTGAPYTSEGSGLTSRTIDLSGADPHDTMLSFYLSSDLQQNSDVLEVDGWDGQNWTFLTSYTGTQSGTRNYLLPANMLTDKFQLRFRLTTGGSSTAGEVYLDDVGIASVPPNNYGVLNGTSMATPHVTGTVALLAAASPNDSVATRIDRILSSVDQVSSLSGKCVTGGRLNVAKALESCVVVTGVAPSSGLTWGGTPVVITGVNFTGVTGVTIGGVPATSYTVDSSTQITATVPAHVAGKADVVVATSGSGTSGAASTSDDYMYVSPAHIEQGDSRLDYLGTWSVHFDSVLSGGSYSYSNQPGSSAMVAFTGTQLHLITCKGKVFGIANISVDGGAPVSVNLYSATDQYRQDVWSTGVLANGLHTVRITCSGQKDAAATGTYVGVDAVETDGTFSSVTNAQQNDTRLFYRGAWAGYSNTVFFGGSYLYSQTAGASVTIPFTGQKLDWIGVKGPIFGKANVSVDGGAATQVDLYASTVQYRQDVYSTGVLANGLHAVTISYTGTRNAAATGTAVNADAFEVVGAVASANRFEQTDSKLVWQKTWTLASGTYFSGGNYRYVNVSGASVTINFNGVSLNYIATKSANMGKVSVSVDGKAATVVDLYAASTYFRQTVFSTGILALGNHSVKISWTGQRRYIGSGSNTVNIDAVDVVGTLH